MSQTCRAIFGEATSNQGAGRISDQAGPVGEANQRALGELRQSCVRRRGVPDVCRIRFVEGSTIRLDARLRGRTSETYFRTTTTAMTPMPIATMRGTSQASLFTLPPGRMWTAPLASSRPGPSTSRMAVPIRSSWKGSWRTSSSGVGRGGCTRRRAVPALRSMSFTGRGNPFAILARRGHRPAKRRDW